MKTKIDVIVPIYRGLEETKSCIRSIVNSEIKTSFRLILINDCSPEPLLTDWLRELTLAEVELILIENQENLGFVATVNKGMSLSSESDIVLLNSDTEVANDWLDRLMNVAYSDKKIGTVTPFSNNATICSYPKFCQDNDLPNHLGVDQLDHIFSNFKLAAIDIPTAVGFCMYIKRSCLETVGLFDVEKFGKGYGEENDFSCRAYKKGWRNVLACGVFVWHKGNVSFGDSHNTRKQQALDTLRHLHPEYDALIQEHLLADPAREYRILADIRRWKSLPLPKILFITHNRGGGTERHCHETAEFLHQDAIFFSVKPVHAEKIVFEAYSSSEFAKMFFNLAKDRDSDLFSKLIQEIGINLVHIHHFLGVPKQLLRLAKEINVPQYFTAHDYYPLCPKITLTGSNNRYCNELGEAQCRECLKTHPIPEEQDIITWRITSKEIIDNCDVVITPNKDVAIRYQKYFGCQSEIIPHIDLAKTKLPPVQLSEPNKKLKVGIIGALSPIKGADLLESVADIAFKNNSAIEFCLFGYAYRQLKKLPNLSITGKYDEEDLQSLISNWKPDIFWFPALWPETYSYTLSEALKTGLPIVATNIGAINQRLEGRPYSWVLPFESEPVVWLNWFVEFSLGRKIYIQKEISQSTTKDPESFYKVEYFKKVTFLDKENNKDIHLSIDEIKLTRKPSANLKEKIKQKILFLLIKLRGSFLLRKIVKHIPMSWQRHIKSKLIG